MLPLEGIEIIDVGTLTPGKYCGFLLADLGASVVRVERAPASANLTAEDQALNRAKRSIALDLRSELGLAALHGLAARADVLLEANRPGVAQRLGFGYSRLCALNPEIIGCSISAFGDSGPYRDRPAYDLIFMGLSGIWSALLAGRAPPPAPGIFLADAVTGLTAAFAIVTALLKRERGGGGTRIDLGMLDATFALLAASHGLRRDAPDEAAGEVALGPARPPGASPSYRLYQGSDGDYVVLGAVRPASWRALCELIGCERFGDDPYPPLEVGREVIAALDAAFASAPAAEWLARLQALDIDCGPYYSPEAAFDDPQLNARGLVSTEEGLGFIESPLAPSFGARTRAGAGDACERQAPRPGADTEAVLVELGLATPPR